MFFNYSFLFLSLVLMYCNTLYSMGINQLPPEHLVLLHAILNKNNRQAERILQEYPTLNINATPYNEHVPWTVAFCCMADNDYLLKVLIEKGLDITTFGHLLFYCKFKNFNHNTQIIGPKIFKVLLEHGALNQLTSQQQLALVCKLLSIPVTLLHTYIQSVLDNQFDRATIKQHVSALMRKLEYQSKHHELNFYSMHALHIDTLSENLLPEEQTIKEYISNNRMHTIASYISALNTFTSALNFTLNTANYKKLLSFFANEGSTDFVKYLLYAFDNNSLSTSDLETIIATTRAHYSDPRASRFIDKLANRYLNRMSHVAIQDNITQQAIIEYLKQQWLTHKNKNVVKLLRLFVLIQRFLKLLTTPEIAHKIAQFTIADFQDQKFDYLPSLEKVQELIAQKIFEHASLNT